MRTGVLQNIDPRKHTASVRWCQRIVHRDGTDHASCVIPRVDATGIHHPVIRVTLTPLPKPFGLIPGR